MVKKENLLENLEMITPISGAKLADIDYDVAVINKALGNIEENYCRFAKCAVNLSNNGAREIGCVVSIENLKHNATRIVNYIGIVKMLIENSKDDIKNIYRLRRVWQDCKIGELEEQMREEKQRLRNMRESERLRTKRSK